MNDKPSLDELLSHFEKDSKFLNLPPRDASFPLQILTILIMVLITLPILIKLFDIESIFLIPVFSVWLLGIGILWLNSRNRTARILKVKQEIEDLLRVHNELMFKNKSSSKHEDQLTKAIQERIATQKVSPFMWGLITVGIFRISVLTTILMSVGVIYTHSLPDFQKLNFGSVFFAFIIIYTLLEASTILLKTREAKAILLGNDEELVDGELY